MTNDIDALRALVHEVEIGFNTNDAERSVAVFTDDAWAVSVPGAISRGRAELLAAHRAGYEGPLRDQFARYELEDVRFLGDGSVAIGRKRAWATDADGTDLDVGHAMVALYVFARQDDGGWRVAARQNTLVG